MSLLLNTGVLKRSVKRGKLDKKRDSDIELSDLSEETTVVKVILDLEIPLR